MKKLCALTLSLALAASLAAPALADGEMLPLPAPDSAPVEIVPVSAAVGYTAKLTLNGVGLDASAIPACSAPDMLPLRLVAENDHGSASWFADENRSYFYLSDVRIIVDFADNSIEVDSEAAEGAAEVVHGVTFVPAAVLNALEGFAVTGEGDSLAIITPNNAPLVKFAYGVIDELEMASRMKTDVKDFFESLELDYGKNFEDAVFFQGMNINPDAILVGKLTKDADVDAVKAALETFRKGQEETFSWYMGQHLPKVQAAQAVVRDGYVLFLIAEDAGKGVELFNSFVDAQK